MRKNINKNENNLTVNTSIKSKDSIDFSPMNFTKANGVRVNIG